MQLALLAEGGPLLKPEMMYCLDAFPPADLSLPGHTEQVPYELPLCHCPPPPPLLTHFLGWQPRPLYSHLATAAPGGIARQTGLPPRNPCKIDLRYNCVSWPRGDAPHRAGHPDQRQDLGHGLACPRRLMLDTRKLGTMRVGLYAVRNRLIVLCLTFKPLSHKSSCMATGIGCPRAFPMFYFYFPVLNGTSL